MIDAKRVKAFWEKRAEKLGMVAFESIVNLEEDPDALANKIQIETKNVFGFLGDITDKTLIDFGAGVGQWSFRFQEMGAAHITAVDYAESLVNIGRAEAARRKISTIEFVACPAEKFRRDQTYDFVFISGLFVYLNDDQVEAFLSNLPEMLHGESVILLRDGTGVPSRHEINHKMSDHLGAEYSAIYRTKDDYLQIFSKIGMKCVRDENMFPEGHSLNKYPETRLRLYRFEPQ